MEMKGIGEKEESEGGRTGVGCPNFALIKIRFKAKLRKTETVSLRFTLVSRNHTKKFHFIFFVSFALFR